METDAAPERPEVRIGPENLVAGALDDGEELRAGEEALPFRREGGSGDAVREREHGCGTEVEVRAAGSRERV